MAAGNISTSFTDDSLHLHGHLPDVVSNACRFRCGPGIIQCQIIDTDNVAVNIAGHQLSVLQHYAQLGPHRSCIHFRQVLPVIIHRTAQRFFKPQQQAYQGGLSAAGFTHNGHVFSRPDPEADPFQYFWHTRTVRKTKIPNFDGPGNYISVRTFIGTFGRHIQDWLDVFQYRFHYRNRLRRRNHRVKRCIKRAVSSLESDKGCRRHRFTGSQCIGNYIPRSLRHGFSHFLERKIIQYKGKQYRLHGRNNRIIILQPA